MCLGRAAWIITANCWGGVFVLSAGRSGLFSPREVLIGSGPEVCSVVVWASSKLRSALSSEECPLPCGRMCLSELLDSCGAAAARYLISHHMAAGGKVQRVLMFLMGITEVNMMRLSCVGLWLQGFHCGWRRTFLFFWAEKGHASIFNVLWSNYTAAMSAAWLFTLSFWLKQCVRNVKM